MVDCLLQAPRGVANLHPQSCGVEVARVEAASPQSLELRHQALELHTQAGNLQRQVAGRVESGDPDRLIPRDLGRAVCPNRRGESGVIWVRAMASLGLGVIGCAR